MIAPNDSKTIDLVARQQLSQVSAQYGDNLPYSYDRVLNECAFFMEQSAKAAIELGRRLILLKEMEGHGRFVAALEQLGISRSAGHRVMQAALKIANVPTSGHLIQAARSQSKVFELMILDTDDLQALDEGQTVAGITLDDVDRMSVRELRAALRANREDLKAKDAVLSNKNKKLDEMEGKLDTVSRKLAEKDRQKQLEKPDPEREGQALRNEVSGIVVGIEVDGLLRQLQAAFTALAAHTEKTGIDHTPFMAGCINQILKTTQQLQSDFGLWADDYATNTPYWDTEAVQAAAEAAVSKLSFDWEESNEQTPH
jgi:predicted phage tail protein